MLDEFGRSGRSYTISSKAIGDGGKIVAHPLYVTLPEGSTRCIRALQHRLLLTKPIDLP